MKTLKEVIEDIKSEFPNTTIIEGIEDGAHTYIIEFDDDTDYRIGELLQGFPYHREDQPEEEDRYYTVTEECKEGEHKFEVDDDGDAENGPNPNAEIRCSRCGMELKDYRTADNYLPTDGLIFQEEGQPFDNPKPKQPRSKVYKVSPEEVPDFDLYDVVSDEDIE